MTHDFLVDFCLKWSGKVEFSIKVIIENCAWGKSGKNSKYKIYFYEVYPSIQWNSTKNFWYESFFVQCFRLHHLAPFDWKCLQTFFGSLQWVFVWVWAVKFMKFFELFRYLLIMRNPLIKNMVYNTVRKIKTPIFSCFGKKVVNITGTDLKWKPW